MVKEVKAKNVKCGKTLHFKGTKEVVEYFKIPASKNISRYITNRYLLEKLWRLSYTGLVYFEDKKIHKNTYRLIKYIEQLKKMTIYEFCGLSKEVQEVIEDTIIQSTDYTLFDFNNMYKALRSK